MKKARFVRLYSILLIIPLVTTTGTVFSDVMKLPPPDGQFNIGLTYLTVIDSSRRDPIIKTNPGFRKLLLWIWYPCEPVQNSKPEILARRLPGVIPQFAKMISLPSFMFQSYEKVVSNSIWNAPIATMASLYPVLIFSHGIGIGTVAQNAIQCEALASHGYVVVSIGHTCESCMVSFPEGQSIPADMDRWHKIIPELTIPAKKSPLIAMNRFNDLTRLDSCALEVVHVTPTLDESHRIWTEDTKFVIDKLYHLQTEAIHGSIFSRFDLSRMGIFGQSMGGMTGQKVAFEDKRIKAGINDKLLITNTEGSVKTLVTILGLNTGNRFNNKICVLVNPYLRLAPTILNKDSPEVNAIGN